MTRRGATISRHPLFFARFVELLSVVAAATVIQLGLSPYDFKLPGNEEVLARFLVRDAGSFRVSDAVSNVALFVPAGLLAFALFRKHGRRLPTSIAGPIVLGALLSLAIETLQLFLPSRTSSLFDLAGNAVGACLGVLFGLILDAFVPRIVGTILHEIRERPVSAALRMYCALLFLLASLPLIYAFDRGQLSRAWKSATLVPFAASPAEIAASSTGHQGTEGRSIEVARQLAMRRWGRWAAECASFVILAFLARRALRVEYGFSRAASAALTGWLCGLLAVALSAAQIPVATRAIDATDIVFRLLGAIVGSVIPIRWSSSPGRSNGKTDGVFFPGMTRLAAIGSTAFIVYAGLIPFGFRTDSSAVMADLESVAMVPFAAYAAKQAPYAMGDFSSKVAAYAIWAACLAHARAGRSGRSFRGASIRVMAWGAAMSISIEIAQLFLPVRVTSLTDPIIAVIGCLIGLATCRIVMLLFRFAAEHEVLQPDAIVRPSADAALGLPDRLIASLADPDPNAPTETAPGSRRDSRLDG